MTFRQLFLLLFCLYVPLFLQAQVDRNKVQNQSRVAFEDLEDAMLEEEGKLRLWFNDALTGMPIEGGAVKIAGIGEFITDGRGTVQFDIPEDGTYLVSFRKSKYIPMDFPLEIDAGTVFITTHFSVSPEMELEFVRIVLNWDKHPDDLDLHLVKEGHYHISYQDMHTSSDGTAMLDRDDRNSYGPETITIRKVDKNAMYRCFVHDYSNRKKENSKALGRSKAVVRVYGNGKLLNTFTVPVDLRSNIWNVFNVVNGEIIPVTTVDE